MRFAFVLHKGEKEMKPFVLTGDVILYQGKPEELMETHDLKIR